MKRQRQLIKSVTVILTSGLILLLSLSSTALELKQGDTLPPPMKLIIETEGLESSNIFLSLSMSGKPLKAITKACAECSSREFTINSTTIFKHGQSIIPIEAISSFNGKSGTIVFYPDTKIVHSINFFNLED